ncbi:hypothetical protein [Helicobacter canis]|uniref:hypothetical protein n=1 Tax=Helicobacter canis TaxID=29419 RepID=UPI000E0FF441|nr:hypothetical protein [Helicobacter canis]
MALFSKVDSSVKALSTIQSPLTQKAYSVLSAKRKRFIPTPLPLTQKEKGDRFIFLQSRGEPRTSASSTRAEAGHYCPPDFRARAPRSGRESVAPCGAIEKMDSASAESVDCRADKSARNDRKSV